MPNTLAPAAPREVSLATKLRQYYALTKPRVVQLIVFCALIGMLLAVPGWPPLVPALAATFGIWLVAAAAAAFNCLVEQQIDRRMTRTEGYNTATALRETFAHIGRPVVLTSMVFTIANC